MYDPHDLPLIISRQAEVDGSVVVYCNEQHLGTIFPRQAGYEVSLSNSPRQSMWFAKQEDALAYIVKLSSAK